MKQLSDEEKATFLNGRAEPKTLRGPFTLYRFGQPGEPRPSKDRPQQREYGKWWFEKSVLDEIREYDFPEITFSNTRVRNPAEAILAPARNGLAVRHDWNPFDWLYIMQIGSQDRVDCWVGRAEFQKNWSSPNRWAHRFTGGLTQYCIHDPPKPLITKKPVSVLLQEWSRPFAGTRFRRR